jgi:hypothetical protein
MSVYQFKSAFALTAMHAVTVPKKAGKSTEKIYEGISNTYFFGLIEAIHAEVRQKRQIGSHRP